MVDLTTLTGIEAELAATADYDVSLDVYRAKRRVAALRRKLGLNRMRCRRFRRQGRAYASLARKKNRIGVGQ
jgi:hypothetical protein